jgi:hypothetical protein
MHGGAVALLLDMAMASLVTVSFGILEERRYVFDAYCGWREDLGGVRLRGLGSI